MVVVVVVAVVEVADDRSATKSEAGTAETRAAKASPKTP
jgi:hypothetical protein